MDYVFLLTINLFEANKIQSALDELGIDSVLKDNYHFNLTAGWIDPLCNYNERRLFVQRKDFLKAKELLTSSFNIKF